MFEAITYSWPAVIMWIGVYQSLILVPVLFGRKGENQLANQLLALFIALMGGRLGQLLFLASDPSPFWDVVQGLLHPMAFLYGPLFYFYLRAFLERSFRFRRVHFWHLSPTLLALLLKLSSWLFFPELDVNVLGKPAQVGMPFLLIRVVYALVFVAYLAWGLRLIFRFRRRVREEASFSEEVHFRWLMFLAGVLLLPVASVILTAATIGPPVATPPDFGRLAPYPAYGVSLMIVILSLVTMLKLEVLDGIPESLKVEDEEDLAPTRYESSALTEAQKQRYLSQLKSHMDEQKPFLDQNLTLSVLSSQLGLNNKYLSQVINEKLDQNFLDFINGYRVALAQELLRKTSYQHYTVIAIAQEVGFKSKSAFYTAFKKGTGMTPTEWRRG